MIRFLIRKVFYKKLALELTQIEITENGFSIKEAFGGKTKIFDWKTIKDICFSENKDEIIIQNSNKKIIIKSRNMGWYEFIQNVPRNFLNFDFHYVKTFMDALKPCEICGIIAVKENECLVCEQTSWNDKMSQNKIEYIKLTQADFFSAWLNDGHVIKIPAEPENGFLADKNWKLYI